MFNASISIGLLHTWRTDQLTRHMEHKASLGLPCRPTSLPSPSQQTISPALHQNKEYQHSQRLAKSSTRLLQLRIKGLKSIVWFHRAALPFLEKEPTSKPKTTTPRRLRGGIPGHPEGFGRLRHARVRAAGGQVPHEELQRTALLGAEAAQRGAPVQDPEGAVLEGRGKK